MDALGDEFELDEDTSYLDEAAAAPAAPEGIPGAESTQVSSIRILTTLRRTVKIIGPLLCQNHDCAQSKAESIVMVMTSPRANMILNYVLEKKKTVNMFYILNEKNKIANCISVRVLLIFTVRNFNQMIILKCEQRPQLEFYVYLPCEKIDTCVSVTLTEEHSARVTFINSAHKTQSF